MYSKLRLYFTPGRPDVWESHNTSRFSKSAKLKGSLIMPPDQSKKW